MGMQSALATRIEAAGTIAGDRVHWVAVPQDTALPYIRMQTASDPRPEHLKDYHGARQTRVQVDCFAERYAQARALAEAVIAGMATPAVVEGVRFGRGKATGPRDLGDDTTGKFVHRASVDLLVEHTLA